MAYRNCASTLSRRPSETPEHGPDVLRTRAARYRNLADTLLDPRVIDVVRACARELEMEATALEIVDLSWSDNDQARF